MEFQPVSWSFGETVENMVKRKLPFNFLMSRDHFLCIFPFFDPLLDIIFDTMASVFFFNLSSFSRFLIEPLHPFDGGISNARRLRALPIAKNGQRGRMEYKRQNDKVENEWHFSNLLSVGKKCIEMSNRSE